MFCVVFVFDFDVTIGCLGLGSWIKQKSFWGSKESLFDQKNILVGWLVGSSVGWFGGWLVDWIVDWRLGGFDWTVMIEGRDWLVVL